MIIRSILKVTDEGERKRYHVVVYRRHPERREPDQLLRSYWVSLPATISALELAREIADADPCND